MRYNHESFLPARAFKPRGSVVGGRSISVHGGDSWGQYYEDPRYSSSQGQYVTIDADAGGVWQPITVGAPVGQYVTTNADAGGQWVDNSAAEMAAMNARLEADRQAQLQAAAAYVAANPLPVSGNQIATQYGERDVSMFNPIVQPGQAVTGTTPTQLIDPATGMRVFLSNPNDPFSFTYDNTGTPAIGGTLEQQAALYRPLENKGVFGTIGGDFLEGIKDPYFRNFAIAAATMAAAAALAPAAGVGGVGGSTAGGAGATAFPIDFGSTVMSGGGLGAGSSTAGGFLGGAGDILAGAAGTGGGSLGATGIVGSTAGGFLGGAGEILPGAVGTGGGSLGAAAGVSGSTAGGFLGGAGEILPGAAGTGGGSLGAAGLGLGEIGSAVTEALAGPYGSLIKGGLTLGGLAAADALKPNVDSASGSTSLTSEQLQAMVANMPSMIGQYTSQAGRGGMGQFTGGYNPNLGQSLVNLFPGFSLPTEGPFYGAGRFGVGYAPTAPTVGLV
jgi:hypothetical protein